MSPTTDVSKTVALMRRMSAHSPEVGRGVSETRRTRFSAPAGEFQKIGGFSDFPRTSTG